MARVGGVKDYNRIHRYLRNVYLYGFFSREDFERAGIGGSKDYDYWAAIIRGLFPDMEDSAVWKNKRKYLRVKRRYVHSGAKRLAESYMLHTIDEAEEIPELLCILAELRRRPQSINELTNSVEILGLTGEDDDASKYSTTRRRVKGLQEYGCVIEKRKMYRLREDAAARLSDGGLPQLREYVRFAEGITYPRVAGSFLRRSVEREMLRRGIEPTDGEAFLLRHNVNGDVFDEALVYTLMNAIGERRAVTLTLNPRGGEHAPAELLPTALRVDAKLGRWYLLGMGDKPEILRVSSIRSIKERKPVEQSEWLAAKERVDAAFARTGCSGGMPCKRPVRVEAKLCFDPETESGLRNQFIRELRLGAVERREDGEYYVATVNDPRELMMFLRSYSPWLKVLPGEYGLDAELRESLLRMRESVRRDAK